MAASRHRISSRQAPLLRDRQSISNSHPPTASHILLVSTSNPESPRYVTAHTNDKVTMSKPNSPKAKSNQSVIYDPVIDRFNYAVYKAEKATPLPGNGSLKMTGHLRPGERLLTVAQLNQLNFGLGGHMEDGKGKGREMVGSLFGGMKDNGGKVDKGVGEVELVEKDRDKGVVARGSRCAVVDNKEGKRKRRVGRGSGSKDKKNELRDIGSGVDMGRGKRRK